MQPFLVIRCGAGGGGDFGWGSKFNCAARVGSDDLGYGPGSGFSFKPVQTSSPPPPPPKKNKTCPNQSVGFVTY